MRNDRGIGSLSVHRLSCWSVLTPNSALRPTFIYCLPIVWGDLIPSKDPMNLILNCWATDDGNARKDFNSSNFFTDESTHSRLLNPFDTYRVYRTEDRDNTWCPMLDLFAFHYYDAIIKLIGYFVLCLSPLHRRNPVTPNSRCVTFGKCCLTSLLRTSFPGIRVCSCGNDDRHSLMLLLLSNFSLFLWFSIVSIELRSRNSLPSSKVSSWSWPRTLERRAQGSGTWMVVSWNMRATCFLQFSDNGNRQWGEETADIDPRLCWHEVSRNSKYYRATLHSVAKWLVPFDIIKLETLHTN